MPAVPFALSKGGCIQNRPGISRADQCGIFRQRRETGFPQRLPALFAPLQLFCGDMQFECAGMDVNLDLVTILHKGDRAACRRFGPAFRRRILRYLPQA